MTMLQNIRSRNSKAAANVEPPRATAAPVPALGSPRNYSPEALNFAQRIVDDQAEIERLKLESDNWRSRALATEEQCRRLEMQADRERQDADVKLQKIVDHHDREIAKLAADRARETEQLTEQRDFYKMKYARTVERLQVSGKIILDALSEPPERETKPPPQVNLSAMAAELENPDANKSEDAQESHGDGGSQPNA